MKASIRTSRRSFWASGKQLAAGMLLLLAIPLNNAQASTTIYFGNIADGTPASANNPYDGILNLQAETGHWVSQDGVTWTMVWTESTIQSGALTLLPALASPSEESGGNYYSRMSANFLQPVSDVSFSVFTWRHAVYSFTGVDGAGDTYSGWGTTAPDLSQVPGDWLTISLGLPTGYFLTSFTLNNSDPSPANAGIWIQDIAFTSSTTTTLTSIPEPNLLTFFSLICAGLLWVKARSTRRRLVPVLTRGHVVHGRRL